MELLITTKPTNRLLGLDWTKHLRIKLEIEKTDPEVQNIQEDTDVIKLKRKFKKNFRENKTVQGMEVDIQLNPDAKLKQPNCRLIPLHLQPAVDKEMKI